MAEKLFMIMKSDEMNKMGMMIITTMRKCGDPIATDVKCLKQGLAHSSNLLNGSYYLFYFFVSLQKVAKSIDSAKSTTK